MYSDALSPYSYEATHTVTKLYTVTRGWHSNIFCTSIFVHTSQNLMKQLSWHCIDFTIVGFIAEILLDLDQLHHIYQRVIVVWLLTMKNISSWLLTFILTVDEDRSTWYSGVSPPCSDSLYHTVMKLHTVTHCTILLWTIHSDQAIHSDSLYHTAMRPYTVTHCHHTLMKRLYMHSDTLSP